MCETEQFRNRNKPEAVTNTIHVVALHPQSCQVTKLDASDLRGVSHLFLCLNVEFITADQLQHLLCPQTQKLFREGNLHKVLMQEAAG